MKGPDHSSSLDPEEFKNFVKMIKNTEKIISLKNSKVSTEEWKKLKSC